MIFRFSLSDDALVRVIKRSYFLQNINPEKQTGVCLEIIGGYLHSDLSASYEIRVFEITVNFVRI